MTWNKTTIANIWKWAPNPGHLWPRDFKWVKIASSTCPSDEAAEAWLNKEAKDRGHEIDEDGTTKNGSEFLYEYDFVHDNED